MKPKSVGETALGGLPKLEELIKRINQPQSNSATVRDWLATIEDKVEFLESLIALDQILKVVKPTITVELMFKEPMP